MELKDFLETDDFYNLSNDAKLLYLYLLAYGLIKISEFDEPITVM